MWVVRCCYSSTTKGSPERTILPASTKTSLTLLDEHLHDGPLHRGHHRTLADRRPPHRAALTPRSLAGPLSLLVEADPEELAVDLDLDLAALLPRRLPRRGDRRHLDLHPRKPLSHKARRVLARDKNPVLEERPVEGERRRDPLDPELQEGAAQPPQRGPPVHAPHDELGEEGVVSLGHD